MSINRKKITFSVISVLLYLLITEVCLSILTATSQSIKTMLLPEKNSYATTVTVPDSVLGHRPSPAYPDHDSNGFRNKAIPSKAHIVALGDSQTYGTGVEPDESWPIQLSSMIDRPVYNMAFGGWGPAHSLLLMKEAIKFKPEIIIEAVYAGNDLYDSFNLVYYLEQLTNLKTQNKSEKAAIIEAERSETLSKHVSRVFLMDKSVRRSGPIAKWFEKHLKIYCLVNKSWRDLTLQKKLTEEEEWMQAIAFAEENPDQCDVFSQDNTKTIFTPDYRLSAVNMTDPRIREGLNISLKAINQMDKISRESDIRLLVILIPTKELVYAKKQADAASESYAALVLNESRFWSDTKSFLDEHHIKYIDMLPALRTQLQDNPQPYKVTADGHPNKYGYRVIAKKIARHLKM